MTLPPHVEAYLQGLPAGTAAPRIVERLDRKAKDLRPYDLLYRVDEHVWIHVRDGEAFADYLPVVPLLDEAGRSLVDEGRELLFREIPKEAFPAHAAERRQVVDAALDRILAKAGAPEPVREAVRYHLRSDILGSKVLEPIIRDPWIEDIHAIGTQPLWVVHKVFGACRSGIRFPTVRDLDAFLVVLSESMGRPVSEARPIVDGALQDGSRINIVFGESVSRGGSSFTVRKFSDQPTPITQLIAWGTMDSRIGAYLWLCMEHGMSVFVSGETASGKTTTLNAMLPMVPANAKVLSAEDTPEVRPPHTNWQQLVTRESGEASSRVAMGDLLKVGLRSRPDRIIVGEIRGVEGAVAFQAMQTGYPTFATFHAASVQKLIQRMTSDPIRVPPQFLPNLQVVLVQLAVHVGGRRLRRVIEVEEIEGYSRRAGVPVTRQVFRWDPVRDGHDFGGRNNSYVLENLVAPRMGLADPRTIYQELERRAAILDDLVRRGQFDYAATTAFFQGRAERPPLVLTAGGA